MTVVIVSFLAAFAASGCIVTGAHCAAWVHAAEHRLTVFFMPATGERAKPRETGPLNVLPVEPEEPRTSLLAPEWTAAPYAGHHAAREPRETPAPLPGLSGIDVYQRFVRMCADAGIEHPEFGPLRPTPPEGIEVTRDDGTMLVGGMSVFDPAPAPERPSMSMLPLTGPIPRIHSGTIRAGLSFDCGNGLHAPVCDGRNCSCSCHGKTYGEACQADVEAQAARYAA